MQKVADAADGVHVKKLVWGKFWQNNKVFLAFSYNFYKNFGTFTLTLWHFTFIFTSRLPWVIQCCVIVILLFVILGAIQLLYNPVHNNYKFIVIVAISHLFYTDKILETEFYPKVHKLLQSFLVTKLHKITKSKITMGKLPSMGLPRAICL